MNSIDVIVETTKSIAANPSDVEAYKKRAITLCQMQQYDDAIKDLDVLIETLHTDDAEVYQLRGALRMNRKDKMGAISDMRRALDLNPQILSQLNGEFNV